MRLTRLVLLLPTLLAALLSLPAASADDGELLQAVHGFLHEQASALGDELIIELRPPSARLPTCESPAPS